MDETEDGEDVNDTEFLANYERELEEEGRREKKGREKKTCEEGRRSLMKRKEREDDDISAEDDFITVVRRKPKRLIRSDSLEIQANKRVDLNKIQNDQLEDVNIYEVCVTAIESLPKQMALAKLLRSENIKGVSRVKYKSFNKVLLQLNEEEEANKLLNCQKFKEMGFRCQKVNELSLSYGIVKGVDMELNEKDLQNIFESETEIISINRLKRLNSDGKWIDSETVRVGFKGNALPAHIYAYDVRLKVEAYVFPVTQCSGCWQFGHVFKFCPTKKKLCPKCGGNHENCDTKEYKCLNCKGPHFVLEKTCPSYLKEKQIRIIMSNEQVPYRRALQLFIENRERSACRSQNSPSPPCTTSTATGLKTYSEIVSKTVRREPRLLNTSSMECSNEVLVEPRGSTIPSSQSNKSKKTKKRTDVAQSVSEQVGAEHIGVTQREEGEKSNEHGEELRYRFEFTKLLIKIKNIFTSEAKLEEKVVSVLKIIWQEFLKILGVSFSKGEFIDKFFSFING